MQSSMYHTSLVRHFHDGDKDVFFTPLTQMNACVNKGGGECEGKRTHILAVLGPHMGAYCEVPTVFLQKYRLIDEQVLIISWVCDVQGGRR